ncbi:FAD-dependent oxidoreductase [Candidatus Azambacteria bacterium]|nr:FAD-dependent oxidoreductase [Candidatus Azambacteria bacterium]
MMYDIVIIGGGPAGCAAGVYAARKKLKALLLTETFGGQSIVSDDIQNWVGAKSISGFDLAKNLEEHVRAQEGIEIKVPEKGAAVKEIKGGFEVTSDKGATYQTKTVLIASGGRRRKLGVPGEEKFNGKGVAYCSTCDAPLFKGKTVVVVGGGNAGLEAAVDLLPYAAKIYLLEFGSALKGDPVTQAELKKSPMVTIITNAQTKEVMGDKFVSGLKYSDRSTNEEKTLEVGGIFVEIGSIPNSEMVKGLVEMNPIGEILVDHKHSSTSKVGIWAAGDVTDDPYKQNNISAGDAVKATLSIYNYLLKTKK